MAAIHEDDDLDALLGAVIVMGGELDAVSDDKFIWVECRCGDSTHTTAVRKTFQDDGYKNRKIDQIRSIECLWRRR